MISKRTLREATYAAAKVIPAQYPAAGIEYFEAVAEAVLLAVGYNEETTAPYEYTCANGHPFPRALAIPCEKGCGAQVACEPIAAGKRWFDEAEALRAILEVAQPMIGNTAAHPDLKDRVHLALGQPAGSLGDLKER